MDHGDRMSVACPLAARRQDGQAEGEAIGSVALASDRAGWAWDCSGVRRELGRPAGYLAERACRPRCDRPIRSRACRRSAFPKEGRHNSLASDPGQPERKERRERRDLLRRETQASAATLADYQQYVGSYYGANEQCVSLTRDFDSSLPPSSQWQQGELVEGATDIAPGTPIATFNFNGAYGPPDSPGGASGVSHTGIYLGQDASGVQILDQWSGSGGASIHTIPWSSWGGNTAEAGSHYYTIK